MVLPAGAGVAAALDLGSLGDGASELAHVLVSGVAPASTSVAEPRRVAESRVPKSAEFLRENYA